MTIDPYKLDQLFRSSAVTTRSAARQAHGMAAAVRDLRAGVMAGLPHELLAVTRREVPKLLEALAAMRLAIQAAEAEAQALTREAAEALKET